MRSRTNDHIRRASILGLAAAFLFGCAPEAERPANEPAVSLFDGETLAGWRGLGQAGIPEGHWIVEDGAIRKVETDDVPPDANGDPVPGGDIMTNLTFRDFDLSFEWKVSPGGNSGVKYNVSEEISTTHDSPTAALGFEYQVLDDDEHPDGALVTHRSADLYDLVSAADDKGLEPVGEWNEGRVVLIGNHGEHWLNGKKVLEYDLATSDFEERYGASKYAPIEGFADRREGHIVLQDHSDDAWFRNLKIREVAE